MSAYAEIEGRWKKSRDHRLEFLGKHLPSYSKIAHEGAAAYKRGHSAAEQCYLDAQVYEQCIKDRTQDSQGRIDPILEPSSLSPLGSLERARAFVKTVVHLDWIMIGRGLAHRSHHHTVDAVPYTAYRIEGTFGFDEAIKHIFPQYSIIGATFQPDFIGRLERFNLGWKKLQTGKRLALLFFNVIFTMICILTI